MIEKAPVKRVRSFFYIHTKLKIFDFDIFVYVFNVKTSSKIYVKHNTEYRRFSPSAHKCDLLTIYVKNSRKRDYG